MTKKKEISPEIQEALSKVFSSLCEKDSVENYPCKDVPCEYWWVRYATGCTYFTNAFDKMWQPKLYQMRQKYHFEMFSHRGIFKIRKDTVKEYKEFGKRKIWICVKGKGEIEITNQYSELWQVLDRYIQEQEEMKMMDCIYQKEKQSVCPFYKASEFYKARKESKLTDSGSKSK